MPIPIAKALSVIGASPGSKADAVRHASPIVELALITSVFDPRLRTRIIAISQGTFTACHLSGPIVGGMFAAMHWWRGSSTLRF